MSYLQSIVIDNGPQPVAVLPSAPTPVVPTTPVTTPPNTPADPTVVDLNQLTDGIHADDQYYIDPVDGNAVCICDATSLNIQFRPTLTCTSPASTCTWTIEQQVSPSAQPVIFQGDTQELQYLVTYTKTCVPSTGSPNYQLCGTVAITNNSATNPTRNLTIPRLLLKSGAVLLGTINDPVDLAGNPLVSSHPVVAPGETWTYTFRCIDVTSVASYLLVDQTYSIQIDVGITNFIGHTDLFFTSPVYSLVLAPCSTSGESTNNQVCVKDNMHTQAQLAVILGSSNTLVSASGSYTFTISVVPPIHIDDTESFVTTDYCVGLYDSSTCSTLVVANQSCTSTTVVAFPIIVRKDASTSMFRTYNWTLNKTASPSSISLLQNQSGTANFNVTVGATVSESNWVARGHIFIYHHNVGHFATIGLIQDQPSGELATNISTTIFPLPDSNVGEYQETYEIGLPTGSTRTNNTLVELKNQIHHPDGTETLSGTSTTFEVPIALRPTISFSPATLVFSIDATATLTDGSLIVPLVGATVVANASVTPITINILSSQTSECPTMFDVTNTANLQRSNSLPPLTASATVTVDVTCPPTNDQNCVRSKGYFKNHLSVVTPKLPIALGSFNVTTTALAAQVFNLAGTNGLVTASNGLNKLYAQLLAAELNIKLGASPTPIAVIRSLVQSFLVGKTSATWSSLSVGDKASVTSWATTLDQYNNGLLAGVTHCDDCTRSLDYYKRHCGQFGSDEDEVTPLLLRNVRCGRDHGAKTVHVNDASKCFQLFDLRGSHNRTGDSTNGINRLYAQLTCSRLNEIRGSTCPESVRRAMDDADDFLSTHDSTSWLSCTRRERDNVKEWGDKCQRYNGGDEGVPNCDDDSTAVDDGGSWGSGHGSWGHNHHSSSSNEHGHGR